MINQNIPTLTGIRGIAAVWVVLFHIYPSISDIFDLPGRSAVPQIASGFLGVDLFFILSGFILSHVHARDFITFRSAEHLRFLQLRLSRVYPLHLVCLLGFGLVVFLLPGALTLFKEGELTVTSLIETLLLVQNWGVGPFSSWNSPTWSLSAEVLGYLAFPAILLAIRRYVPRGYEFVAVVVLLGVLLGFCYANHYASLDTVGKTGVLRMFIEFSVGCLLYRRLSDANADRLSYQMMFFAALVILVVCTANTAWSFGAVFGLTLLVAALAVPCWLGRVMFANPFSLFLGKISFSLYLCHMPMLIAFDWHRKYGVGWSRAEQQMLVFGMGVFMLVLAFLLWKFVERPSQMCLRAYIRKGDVFSPARTSDTPESAPNT